MSERFWNNLSVVVLAIVATTSGTYFGMREGRAEMKRWQDTWYAANWQSPEVVESRVEVAFQKGQEFQIFVEEHSAPAPPKKAKPAKAAAQPVSDSQLLLNCAPNFDCNKHSDIDPQGAVCVAGSSDGHPIEAPCPQITRPQNCAIYDGQPFPCTIPVQLDILPAPKP